MALYNILYVYGVIPGKSWKIFISHKHFNNTLNYNG